MQCVLLVYSTWIYRHYECFSKSASHCRSLSALYVIGSFCIQPKLFTWNARNLLVKMISVVPVSLCMIWFIMENFLSSYRCTHSMESQKTCCITLKYIQFRCPTERQRNEPFQSNLAHFECLNSRKIIIFRIYRYKLQRSNAFKCICFFVPKIDANWFNWDAWHTLNFRNW